MGRSLDLDARREERGQDVEEIPVKVEGVTHMLPPVLPMGVLSKLVEVLDDGEGGVMKLQADSATELLRRTPGLVDAFAQEFGDWMRRLGPDEFIAVFELYDIGGSLGEPSGS